MKRENYLNYILGQLADLEELSFRKMIGGVAFFYKDHLFGAIRGGCFQLRHICEDMDERLEHPNLLMLSELHQYAFCAVPDEVINDKKALIKLIHKSLEQAQYA